MQKIISIGVAGLLESAHSALVRDQHTNHLSDKGLNNGVAQTYEFRTEKLTAHLIHHTHDDVGWVKTVDEYYTGVNNDIARVEVQLILDETIPELIKDSKKRFSYVEMKFFSMWWKDQTDQMKEDVRMLVREGRLELLNAGWSMHDEACPHYEDMINNMMAGHDFAMQEFGVRPTVGWQVDPFGHSNANARLFAEMGFDAFFFGRLDYQDKEKRLAEKTMEWVWRPMFDSLGDSVQIFAHADYNLYQQPDGFDFDTLSDNEPFIIDESLTTYNAPERSLSLYNWLTHQASHYATNDIMVTFGGDFRFQNARQYFSSSDNMINYWNANIYPLTNIELIYSTPSMYIDAQHAKNLEWPTKYDDMFPYADNAYSFWTGYFSSRANDKKYMRDASHTLHSSNKLFALAAINQKTTDAEINAMLSAKAAMMDVVGTVQHHDGITGTGKQHTADDYVQRIFKGITKANPVYASVIAKLAETAGISESTWTWCQRQNGTWEDCPVATATGDYNMVIANHNPAVSWIETIEIKVPHGHFRVQRFEGTQWIDAEANVLCNTQSEEDYPSKKVENCRMYVQQSIVPGQVAFTQLIYDASADLTESCTDSQTIESSELQLTYTGIVDGIAFFNLLDKVTGDSNPVGVSLRYWKGYQVQNADYNQPSGVYIFRPDQNEYDSILYSEVSSVQGTTCSAKSHFIINFTASDSKTQGDAVVTITLEGLPVIKYEVELYELPSNSQIGFEVTVNFHTNLDNQEVFYTDSNGLEMQRRQLNYRPTWNLTIADGGLNVTANYYPIQTAIAMIDPSTNMQFIVMNDRSQGGSVLQNGRVELMQNRRLNVDDWRGMEDPLNEHNYRGVGISVPATYYVQLFNMAKRNSVQRQVQQIQDQPLQQFFAFNVATPNGSTPSYIVSDGMGTMLETNGFNGEMKFEMFMMGRNSILVRVENIADIFNSNGEVIFQQVNIRELANQLFVYVNDCYIDFTVDIEELSLTGNQPYSTMSENKKRWLTVDDETVIRNVRESVDSEDVIELQQQRIRVFNFKYTVAVQQPASFLQ